MGRDESCFCDLFYGPVAPIGRAPDLHSGCCGFESHPVHFGMWWNYRHGGIATGFSIEIIQQCQCELGAAAVRRVGVSPTVPTNGKLTAFFGNSDRLAK